MMAPIKGAVRTSETKKKRTASASEARGSLITFSDEELSKYVRILLCGRAKTGKTYFAGTWPSPLFINTDKGMKTLASSHIPSIDILQGEPAWRIMRRILENLEEREGEYWEALLKAKYEPKTIVLDSVSSLSSLMEIELLNDPPEGAGRKNPDGGLQIQDYNCIQNRLYGLLRQMAELHYNIIVTSSTDYLIDEGNGRLYENPSVSGNKAGPQIPHFFDDVYYHSYSTDTKKWILNPQQTIRFNHAGSRGHIPLEIVENPTYQKLKKYYEK